MWPPEFWPADTVGDFCFSHNHKSTTLFDQTLTSPLNHSYYIFWVLSCLSAKSFTIYKNTVLKIICAKRSCQSATEIFTQNTQTHVGLTVCTQAKATWCKNRKQNNNFGLTGSYFMERMSLGFYSDILQLLCLDTVIHGGSWKQHVGYLLQTEAAAEQHRGVLLFCATIRGGLLASRWRSSIGIDTRTRAESAGNVTELNSLH